MESFVVTTAMLKYNLIMEKALSMEPFFNVFWEDGYVAYYQVILLKSLFNDYAVKRVLPRNLSIALFVVLSMILMRPTLSLLWQMNFTQFLEPRQWDNLYKLIPIVLFLLPIPSCITYSVLALVSLAFTEMEFICDVYFVVGFACYVYQGYGREFGKMAAAVFLSLGFMWLTITRLLTAKQALLSYILLIMVIFPLMPKLNRVRLTHLNCLLSGSLSYRYIRSGISLWMMFNPTEENEEYLAFYRIRSAEK